MVLLLLCLETANVNAQVRIGGNTPPNASALLDLNATDATMNGTKGLALPRVDLTSPTMLLSGVTWNLTGMMVYNTTATLGRIGIYYWNGAQWVLASLPSTSATDSGKVLMFNGSTWVATQTLGRSGYFVVPDTLNATWRAMPVTWTLVLDTSLNLTRVRTDSYNSLQSPGIRRGDICTAPNSTSYWFAFATTDQIILYHTSYVSTIGGINALRLRCYRPSA